MPNPGSLRPQDQCGTCRPHASEFRILLSYCVDAGVGLAKRPTDRWRDPLPDMLLVEVRNVLNGLGAGLLADRVAAHAVGHDEDVPAGLEPGGVYGGARGAGVLIVTPLHAHIGQGRIADRLECRHERLPDNDSRTRLPNT